MLEVLKKEDTASEPKVLKKEDTASEPTPLLVQRSRTSPAGLTRVSSASAELEKQNSKRRLSLTAMEKSRYRFNESVTQGNKKFKQIVVKPHFL
mmetsp:Transcript_12883/g.25968  ORF Transcript_12883/g.25968 Transcript_12883/m.25968 type:complete len:94 (-) Transcript_12883:376-657(-)